MQWWSASLIAGAIAALAAALVSLPLKSPDDGLLNTGTVGAWGRSARMTWSK
jgi:hypothetical protein